MANIPSGLPQSFKQTFPNTKDGIKALLQAKERSKSEKLLKLKRTQADLDTERLARIQADQARIQADQARIQERDARIQAEKDLATVIQEMRNAGVPETTIERVLKKAKTQHKETPHG